MSNSTEKKGFGVSAFSVPEMGKLMRGFVIVCLGFCALALMTITAAIADENVEGESSVKDEALETFIKFSGALPERFDAGVTITYYSSNENQTQYLRIRKDGESGHIVSSGGNGYAG